MVGSVIDKDLQWNLGVTLLFILTKIISMPMEESGSTSIDSICFRHRSSLFFFALFCRLSESLRIDEDLCSLQSIQQLKFRCSPSPWTMVHRLRRSSGISPNVHSSASNVFRCESLLWRYFSPLVESARSTKTLTSPVPLFSSFPLTELCRFEVVRFVIDGLESKCIAVRSRSFPSSWIVFDFSSQWKKNTLFLSSPF